LIQGIFTQLHHIPVFTKIGHTVNRHTQRHTHSHTSHKQTQNNEKKQVL